MSRNRKLLYGGLGGLVVVALLVGLGLWWFLEDDAPPEVDLETAIAANTGDASTTTATVDATTTTEAAVAPTTTAAEAPTTTTIAPTTTTIAPPVVGEGIDGVWAVDTTIGDFDFSSATGSFAGFRVQEELSGIGSKTAVGRTGEIAGTMTISGTTLEAVAVDVDLSTITTDDSRRDSRARGALNTSEHPIATFVMGQPIELGEVADAGGPVSVSATGSLTINGVTNEATFAIEAQLVAGIVFVIGSSDVLFSDYDVTAPSSPAVLSIDDNGVIEMQLLFTPA